MYYWTWICRSSFGCQFKYYKVSDLISIQENIQLSKGIDYNDEIDLNKGKKNLKFSDKEEILRENNIFVIMFTPVFQTTNQT